MKIEKSESDVELASLDETISKAQRFLVGWVAISGLIYICGLFVASGREGGGWTATAGVIRDFFGGVINPVVSYAAFYWLTKGVRFQKEELSATRFALAKAADSQAIQVGISALSALIEAEAMTGNDLQRRMDRVHSLREAAEKSLDDDFKVRGINTMHFPNERLNKNYADLADETVALKTLIIKSQARRAEYAEKLVVISQGALAG